MGGEWFCEIGGREIGPLLPQQLRAMAANGQIVPTDRVRHGKSGNWASASRVKGLFPPPETPRRTDPPKALPLDSEPMTHEDTESEDYSLLANIPLQPRRYEEERPEPVESEEYELVPLPSELIPKFSPQPKPPPSPASNPKEDASSKLPSKPPSKPKPGRQPPPVFAQGVVHRTTPKPGLEVRPNNSLLDSGLESLSEDAIQQAGVGSPLVMAQARRRRQQQQRLFVALAIIGIGVGMAVGVLIYSLDSGHSGDDTKGVNKPKNTNAAKRATSQSSPVQPQNPTAEQVEKPAAKSSTDKKTEKPVDEPVPAPTGDPGRDFGIPTEDEPSPVSQPKPDKKS